MIGRKVMSLRESDRCCVRLESDPAFLLTV